MKPVRPILTLRKGVTPPPVKVSRAYLNLILIMAQSHQMGHTRKVCEAVGVWPA